jgi:hypothetical protein
MAHLVVSGDPLLLLEQARLLLGACDHAHDPFPVDLLDHLLAVAGGEQRPR